MWLLVVSELYMLFSAALAGECHCFNASACTASPATTCGYEVHGGCIKGWFGPTCQKQNVALKKPAAQTSVWYEPYETSRPLNLTADYAVDGLVSTHVNDSPCAHTDTGDMTPSWKVLLNTSSSDRIHHMKLYLRNTWPGRNRGMQILVDNQTCYNWSSTEGPHDVTDVTCRQPLSGNTVIIRTPQEYLTLCEVQIYVCSDGWFGDDCGRQCHCRDNMDVCDKISGSCSSGCTPGFIGANCQTPSARKNNQPASNLITLAVGASIGVVTMIIVLVASLYIRRLKMKIKALEKKREEPYVSLDEATRAQSSETCYSQLADA
ncbi:uncharacterized protein LOC124117688 isoform X2 [Haliotis rufescens]|uniref:uncharacterized protein LOC124117688 isoform X2 n=1 Tax=Haliotis rufescens TaxID=6454 RepID=UPI00201F4602|nr:uncharacterized protein LOC124117688 isoform X2 [Haliotis rufescens]